MGFFKPTDEEKAAKKKYDDAMAELERVSKRDQWESPDYDAANSAVIEAEKDVPWYRRLP